MPGSSQSNFVRVTSDGSCSWWPRFAMSTCVALSAYLKNHTFSPVDCCVHSAKEPSSVAGSSPSSYIRVTSDGGCSWWPRFEMSASHCPMNIAWFPFDEQRCQLVYESWRYPTTELNISVPTEPVIQGHYKTSGEWDLVGTSCCRV